MTSTVSVQVTSELYLDNFCWKDKCEILFQDNMYFIFNLYIPARVYFIKDN